MGFLSPLLEIQDIDRECDRLLARRRALPERAAQAQVQARIARIDEAHAALLARRGELDRAEHELAEQVEAVAARAQGMEDTLYGGTVKAAKDLRTLQEESGHVREQQAGLEDQEMELLEAIERTEAEMAENRRERAEVERELAAVERALQAAERVIDDELAAFGRDRAGLAEKLPAEILEEYAHLRLREKLGGIAAALFTDKGCGGCKMQLPRVESRLMREQPEDALLRCENCGRLLVR